MKPKRAIFIRKFGKIAGSIFLFILFSGCMYWIFIRLFRITNIVVVGNNMLVQIDESKLPKTLLLFPSEKLRSELLENNPVLADIRFQKKYPHTLMIVTSLRTAVVRLVAGSREVLLDGAAVVLADVASIPSLHPRLIVPTSVVRIGETIRDRRVIMGIELVTGLRDIAPVRTISVEDESSLRAKSDIGDIIFPQDQDTQQLLATLQTLLTGFRIKGTLPTFIDLRFNKPIIKF